MIDPIRAKQAAAIAQNAKDKADATQQAVGGWHPIPSCAHTLSLHLVTNIWTTSEQLGIYVSTLTLRPWSSAVVQVPITALPSPATSTRHRRRSMAHTLTHTHQQYATHRVLYISTIINRKSIPTLSRFMHSVMALLFWHRFPAYASLIKTITSWRYPGDIMSSTVDYGMLPSPLNDTDIHDAWLV